jgi:hypothetical protein
VGLDKPTKLKPQCHNNHYRHQHLNHKHQCKQEVLLVVEVEEVALHNLLENEQTPLSNNRLQQDMHPLMEH